MASWLPFAPMSLITYEDVRPWARSIKLRTGLGTRMGVMPPWFIDKHASTHAAIVAISFSLRERSSL